MQRKQRQFAAADGRALELVARQQLFRITVGAFQVLGRDLVLRRQLAVDALCEREVAGVGSEFEPGPGISLGQRALFEQRSEQRLAGIRRIRSGEPQSLRLGQRLGALRDQALLQRIADEFGIFFLCQRVLLREQVPAAALAQRFQPVAAQADGKQ